MKINRFFLLLALPLLFLPACSRASRDAKQPQVSVEIANESETDFSRMELTLPAGQAGEKKDREMAFSYLGLNTNTAIRSIPLKEILDGGPPKDGIPAIQNPKFEDLAEVDWLDDEQLGILYQGEKETRFYPYEILYWHEIVNDEVEGIPISVTFCPLCGSAIIFDRNVDGETLRFGVSGKLWESNLMMYDTKTESLWSQILGEAVVGDYTGKKLTILDGNIITWADAKANYPNTKVLSQNTGFTRSYGRSPYGNYEENNALFFPVSSTDDAFHKKELFHIVNVGDKTVGFMRKDLMEAGKAEADVDGVPLKAEVLPDKTIQVTKLESGEKLPGYTAMWFSWVTHVNKEKVIWSAE